MDSDLIESDSNIDDLLSSLNDDSYDRRHVDEDWTRRRNDGEDWREDSRSHGESCRVCLVLVESDGIKGLQGSMLNASFSQQRNPPPQQQSQSSSSFIHRIRGLAFNSSNQAPPASYKPPNSSQLELRDQLFGSQSRHGRQSNSWTSSQKPTDSRAYALPPPLQPHMKQFPGAPTRYRESSIYEAPPTETSSPPPRSSPVPESYRGTQGTLNLAHAPPIVQGIPLVSLNSLPDRFRSIFPFPVFNAIQSRTFPAVFESSDNLVLSSPTGSGKTVILELAICRMVGSMPAGSYKIIYQAPTKALCAERKRDWEKKFSTLGLTVTELTGDTEFSQIGNVKNGDLIVTTPEKWDSMTRRWQDQRKLLDMVKLFLVSMAMYENIEILELMNVDRRGPYFEGDERCHPGGCCLENEVDWHRCPICCLECYSSKSRGYCSLVRTKLNKHRAGTTATLWGGVSTCPSSEGRLWLQCHQ